MKISKPAPLEAYVKNDLLEEKDKEIERLNNIRVRAIEYIKRYESIRAYYDYQDEEYWETDYDDDFQEELLSILTGGDEE